MRIRFAGAGGQGIVLCGLTFGKAAMLDGKQAIQTQAYGSASRGGLTKSDVGIDSEPIYDLVCDEVDALVALSQEAYDRYARDLLPGGLLFFEADLVAVTGAEGDRAHGIAATDIAFKEFGRKIMANMIMMGFVNERLAAVSHESLSAAIAEQLKPSLVKGNIAAFDRGRRLAAEQR